ncbi:MAG: WYL domain-containing protein [Prosthecobacter sp.]|uniref:WYL domain-containing protein n=1 Tax=Prosthecobacter sp. TaxID=1965333 RepID=UPI0025E8E061|nr:WYL domain-containing protein [Prosthecobacter sp.]MCF7786832.1 WYL domain-containing protein [Prosthecobacter sp.]
MGERLWHSTQAIRKLKNDGSVIEFQAHLSGLEEITRWVLSWGSKAKVLGPPELKQRVREELGKMVQASE